MSATATTRVLKIIAGALAVCLALALPLALVLPGDRSFWRAYVYWALAIPGVLLSWVALESLGTWLFDRPAINRMSSGARIMVVAIGLILIFALIIGILELVEAYGP